MTDVSLQKEIEVAAYSGYKANERPLSFILDQEKHTVKDILDRWYGAERDYFKVLANDEKVYLISWDRGPDKWFLDKIFEKEEMHRGYSVL